MPRHGLAYKSTCNRLHNVGYINIIERQVQKNRFKLSSTLKGFKIKC